MEVNLVVIRTKQPKELAELYNQFGIKFDYHRHGKGSWHYSSEIGKLVFEIYPLMKNQGVADKSLRLGFYIENLDALILNLKTKGIEITSEPQKTK